MNQLEVKKVLDLLIISHFDRDYINGLPNETISFLVKHKETIENEKRVGGILYTDYDLIVCIDIGTPCLPRNLLRSFYSLIEKLHITKIRFYDLRRTHAT